MKKFTISLIVVIVILAGGLFLMQNINLNRIGTDDYYTQIVGSGNKLEDKADGGTVYVRYEYELPAYDKNGNVKTLTFTANKELREDAYLQLFVKDGKSVASYQEVTAEELPKKAAEMLD